MLIHPQFDPVAIQLGPLAIHWYGLMYLVGFGLVWLAGMARIRAGYTLLTRKDLEDLIFYCVLGVVAGGRLGYTLFYQPAYYLSHPLEILYVWQGGMSFHGGLIGVLVTIALFARNRQRRFLEISDFLAPLIPLGLAVGRLGNFINGELWGRPSDVSWAMVFPQVDSIPRHPSQLYEMALEGIALFILLWWFTRRPRAVGQTSALFLIGYGFFRFMVEYTREPDGYLGLLSAGLSMGQWLSLPMIVAGLALFAYASKRGVTPGSQG
ncbi:prolipoprotein diacylglyceryl transferase [Providencia rettgeri]|uniref:Phosphatidylglycerol--prolipoprotein diacylglyceryl transferase n=1 Tax=Alcaligenes parafaecalis TaxID=171260 RepID=A0ABT3VN46_9BURK|nr:MULTISPECIES: prolipoprotein diacylglyceryl transferase [Alcaligenes]MBY6346918.1 prolipoprotein diacylglyceryl transferase [Providencia rettgeri]MCX5464630.1 prolipoprotein diacylglyceryl transferase [Alcaligenes parafaecalis]QTC01580.1 prolipoprotein diacylglyceryl transferase [Alcaligenes sp. SORT26]